MTGVTRQGVDVKPVSFTSPEGPVENAAAQSPNQDDTESANALDG